MIEAFIAIHPWLSYLYLGLFSLIVGSLLNVVIYRLPIMLHAEWEQQCCELLHLPEKQTEPINLFVPRSFCPQCKTQVNAWHNIPILSYLLLRRKCSTCKAPIPIRYPFVEAMTLLLSLYTAVHFGFTIQLPFALIAIWLLICLFFIDLDHQILPDSLTYSLLWLGLIANSFNCFISLDNAVLGAVSAYLSLWLFIKLFYLLTGKIGMGNGDFKLFAAFGAWLGWTMLPLILLASSLSGAIVGALYLKFNKKSTNTPIPFGPFLCIAGLIALFWGKPIMNWYLHVLTI